MILQHLALRAFLTFGAVAASPTARGREQPFCGGILSVGPSFYRCSSAARMSVSKTEGEGSTPSTGANCVLFIA